MSMMSKLTASYLAGLIDGEGSIGFHNGHYKDVSGKMRHYPCIRLRVGMTDKGIIQWLKDSFGGNIQNRIFSNPKHKEAYCWEIKGEKCENVLRNIYPYLRIKKRHCEIALKRFNVRVAGDKDGAGGFQERWTSEQRSQVDILEKELKTLNKRGK